MRARIFSCILVVTTAAPGAWAATGVRRGVEPADTSPSHRPAIGLSYTQLDPRHILAGALDAAGASGVNRSRILAKGKPVTTPALRLAFDVPLFDPIPLGAVAALAAHAGAFAEFSSTELPGVELEREGGIFFHVPSSGGLAQGFEVSAAYEMKASITSYVLGGRADSTAWLGQGPYRLGARLNLLAGAMLMTGKARFSSWLAHLPRSAELASAEVGLLSMGPVVGATAGPVLRMRSVECGGGIGFRYERSWVSLDGDFDQIGVDPRDFEGTVPVTALGRSFDVECALPF